MRRNPDVAVAGQGIRKNLTKISCRSSAQFGHFTEYRFLRQLAEIFDSLAIRVVEVGTISIPRPPIIPSLVTYQRGGFCQRNGFTLP